MGKLKMLFSGRLNRLEFFVGLIVVDLAQAILSILIFIIFTPLLFDYVAGKPGVDIKTVFENFSFFSFPWILLQIIVLLAMIYSISLCVRRFHDIGKNGNLSILLAFNWLVTILLISNIATITKIAAFILVIYLLFKKGELNSNNYGEVPKEKINIKRILFVR